MAAARSRGHIETSFFDLEDRYRQLSVSGDPLERLSRAIDCVCGPYPYEICNATRSCPSLQRQIHAALRHQVGAD